MKTTEEPIVVEQVYDAPIDRVWKAITDHAEMVRWYFEQIPDFKPEVGFVTQFDVQCEDRIFPHLWKITEVSAPHSITYDWRYEGYVGDATVVFAISDQDGATKLTLTHTMVEDSDDEIPEFTREAGLAGWTWFIQKSLKDYLDGAG